tara:strand:- start:210 stop:389 length:180 start_codon:yes stop_codon:yes gene_type:complete
MNISELITSLTELKEKHGDLECYRIYHQENWNAILPAKDPRFGREQCGDMMKKFEGVFI